MLSLQRQQTKNQPTASVERNPQAWATRINAQVDAAVDAIIATGRELVAAKATLKHGDWERLFTGHPKAVLTPVRFSVQTALKLMAIAEHPVLANPAHVRDLPPAWGTLYELSKLPPPVVERGIDDGDITPEMTRADAAQLRPRAEVPQSVETNGDAGLPVTGRLATLPAVGPGDGDADGEPLSRRDPDEDVPVERLVASTSPPFLKRRVDRLRTKTKACTHRVGSITDDIKDLIHDIKTDERWFGRTDVKVQARQCARELLAAYAPDVDALTKQVADLRRRRAALRRLVG